MMNRAMTFLSGVAASVCITAAAQAQSGVFEGMRPGDAVLIASAASGPITLSAVRLDPVCETDIEGPLELRLEDALNENGIQRDPAASVVFRYETAPCESNLGARKSLAREDAFNANSRLKELPNTTRPFEYEFGKNERSGARLTLNVLVFKPGQAPIWNAVVAGRAPGLDTPDYFAQMAAFAIAHLGEGGRQPFEIIPIAGD